MGQRHPVPPPDSDGGVVGQLAWELERKTDEAHDAGQALALARTEVLRLRRHNEQLMSELRDVRAALAAQVRP